MLLNFFYPGCCKHFYSFSYVLHLTLCTVCLKMATHSLHTQVYREINSFFSVHLSLLCFQLIAMVGKMIKAKESGAMYEELPRNTCGMRRLTQVLRNGGGKFLNRDFVKLTGVRRNAQDDMIDSMCFFIGVTAKVFTHFVVYCGLSLTSSQ